MVETVASLAQRVLALEARIAAVETDHGALREEIRTRNAAGRLAALEGAETQRQQRIDRDRWLSTLRGRRP
jgi:hypothetical protein